MMRKQQPAQVYSFPDLKMSEILQCMQNMEIDLAESDIAKPNPAVVQRVFEDLVELFSGLGKDDYAQPDFEGLKGLDYPELVTDTHAIAALGNHAAALMRVAGVGDFTLQDIIKPEAPRLKTHLSAVINLAKFREEQFGVFERLTGASETLQAEMQTQLEKKTALETEIEETRGKHRQEEAEKAECLKATAGFIERLKELQAEQHAATDRFESVKCKRSTLLAQIEAASAAVSELETQCAKLETRIVHSPEKLFQMIEDLKLALNTESEIVSGLEKEITLIDAEISELTAAKNELKKTNDLINSYRTEKEKKTRLEEEVERITEEMEKRKAQIEEHTLIAEQKTKLKQAAEERLRLLRERQAQRRAAIEAKLAEVKRSYEQIAQERGVVEEKQAVTAARIKESEEAMALKKRQHETETNSYAGEFNLLRTQLLAYIAALGKNI
ncbi:MAG: spindle pole body protein Nuf2 [Amphiamblys sp. WSBS2006]|nr:MAG: spindle pole body protein Nuf2 [Amphiamblys sp. WSBS2006]